MGTREGDAGRAPHRSAARAAAGAVALAVVLGALAAAPGRADAALDRSTPAYADRVLVRTYRTIFGRTVTAASSSYWYAELIGHPDPVWFASALMASDEYRSGPGRRSNTAFIDWAYRNATNAAPTTGDTTFWLSAIHSGAGTRASMVAWLVEHRFTYALRRPGTGTRCARYDRAGLVAARCETGSAGSQRDVNVLAVPGTNLRVNRAWYPYVNHLVVAARTAGFDLQGERDPTVPSWMATPGSWRSWDEQLWLYQHGFPANPPGKSMHEWALAIDLDCNGRSITGNKRCWDWVRANGPRFGVYPFHSADQVTDSEAWHFSSNRY